MKIEIWSDFVCPYCYMGKRALEMALAKFPHADKVELIYRSYELDPSADNQKKMLVNEVLMQKYGMTHQEITGENAKITLQGYRLGLNYVDLHLIRDANTLTAHRLLKYAETVGKAGEWTERLMKAHFTDKRFIGDEGVLKNLAWEIGLDQKVVQTILKSNDYFDSVKADVELATSLDIDSIPFFLFNGKYAASGALPIVEFEEMLKLVWDEEQKSTK